MQMTANISMLFTEFALSERFQAAANAGFDGVEIQFPYDENLENICAASKKSGMKVDLINLPAGNWVGGDKGLGALPDRRDDYHAAIDQCLKWCTALNVRKVNVLSGKCGTHSPNVLFETLVENLDTAGDRFAEIGVKVMLEVINSIDMPDFYASNLQTGLDIIAETGHPNVNLQFDFYHMARTEPSLAEAIIKAGPAIGHVQFADAPGRHAPGSGSIDFGSVIKTLKQTGYNDTIAAEYFPQQETASSLAWMPRFKELL